MKKWFSKLTPRQIVTILVACIAAIATIVSAILQKPEDIEAIELVINATQTAEAKLTALAPTSTSTITNTPLPTLTTSPIITETFLPTSTSLPSALPIGYEYFDDFSNANINQRWSIESQPTCSYSIANNLLYLMCTRTNKDIFWRFKPQSFVSDVSGIAFYGKVEEPVTDLWGKIHFLLEYSDTSGNLIRTYNYSLRGGIVYAAEYFETENHRQVKLGDEVVSTSDFHLLQIELLKGVPTFVLDGQTLELETLPTLPSDAILTSWRFEVTVFKGSDPKTIKAMIDWFAIKK